MVFNGFQIWGEGWGMGFVLGQNRPFAVRKCFPDSSFVDSFL